MTDNLGEDRHNSGVRMNGTGPPNALEPTRITRYDLPMSRRLFDIAGPRGSA